MSRELSYRDQIRALCRVAQFRPVFTAGIILLSLMAGVMEGIGISFLLPIIKQARGNTDPGRTVEIFITVYETLGIPFNLETIIVGIAVVMIVRYTASFFVAWSRAILQTTYVRYLQTQAYEGALNARVQYFDKKGSDEILNSIVTESKEGANAINQMVRIVEQSFLILVYFVIALLLAPNLTLATAVVFSFSCIRG
ncbi:ABC transporter transmembrane domain-containing protein [Haloarcula sp. CBA1122]|uniref:ABC transporter transmembrane domain-containing protein n=1 Tax=Haloarcula sp. CBA1122 TaxID=2668069 RepID=UPI00352F4832